MCVEKVLKSPEDPFPRVCESVTYGKSQNVVNGNVIRRDFHRAPQKELSLSVNGLVVLDNFWNSNLAGLVQFQ